MTLAPQDRAILWQCLADSYWNVFRNAFHMSTRRCKILRRAVTCCCNGAICDQGFLAPLRFLQASNPPCYLTLLYSSDLQQLQYYYSQHGLSGHAGSGSFSAAGDPQSYRVIHGCPITESVTWALGKVFPSESNHCNVVLFNPCRIHVLALYHCYV